jgi:DNA primase
MKIRRFWGCFVAIDGIEYVDLLAMAEADGVQLRRESPTEYAGPCPKCGGVDRLHVLTKSKQGKPAWFCRNCLPPETMGDAADYVRIIRGRTAWSDVFADLRAHGLPDNGRSSGRIGQVEARSRSTPAVVRSAAGNILPADGALTTPPATAWQEEVDVLLWGERSGFHLLRDADDAGAVAARAYLARRHLTQTTMHRFALGLLPANVTTKPMGWRAATAGAIVMPWIYDGRYWRVQYRAVGDVPKDQRYRQKKGASLDGALPPFNGEAIDGAGVVLVVEGEMDAMLGQQCAPEGVAVVTWGSASIAPNGWAEELLEGRRVLLSFDTDEKGQQAAERWEVLGKRITLPAGKDLGDYADLHGVDALRAWIAEVTA